jgi:catechol 2,3-dioxygenase-like lactoylglutathione lyase family enzyme
MRLVINETKQASCIIMSIINHITLVCNNLELSSALFCTLFGAKEVYSSERKNFSTSKEKFILVGDLWIALMEGSPTERSYNHIAFAVKEEELLLYEEKIRALGLEIKPDRDRAPEEGKSLYFYDYDNHLFELHTGNLAERLKYYSSFQLNA